MRIVLTNPTVTWRLLGFLALVVAGCKPAATPNEEPVYGAKPLSEDKPVYAFAINPTHNPSRMFEIFGPLADYINTQATNFSLRFEASESYGAFEEKLAKRTLHIALANPYQTLQAEKTGYRVFAKRGDDERFRGLIIVRKDSGITKISDLKGAVISFPSATSMAAAMMQKYYLKMHGLDVDKDAQPLYVNNQDSALMNVYQGRAQAAATWPPAWELFAEAHPAIAAALVVQWETEPLVSNSLMVRDDVPEAHWQQVRELLLNLHTHDAGRALLARMKLARFDPATSATYEPVREFVKKYEAVFGPLPVPKEIP